MTDLSVLPDGSIQYGVATSINSAGEIAGYQLDRVSRAAVWKDGQLSYLAKAGQYIESSDAVDINDLGQAIGSTNVASGLTVAAIWQNGGIRTFEADLGPRTNSNGLAINNHGQALIATYSRAYLWDGNSLQDLSELAGIPIVSAWAINDAGQIVGMTTDDFHVLLTPVPEPAAMVLMLAGLVGTVSAARARRRR